MIDDLRHHRGADHTFDAPGYQIWRPWQAKSQLKRLKLARKQGCHCYYCGEPIAILPAHYALGVNGYDPGPLNVYGPRPGYAKPVIEHCTPIRRGGGDCEANLVLSCWACNNRKGQKTLEEFRAWWANRTFRRVVFYGEFFQIFEGVADV